MRKTMMMWFSMLLLAMVGTMGASAQNLSIADFDIQAGGTKDVTISLVSDAPVYGIQADVVATGGLRITAASAAVEGLYFDSNVVTGGATRVAQLSLSGAQISAGAVINLTIAAGEDFTEGTIELKNIELTTSKDGKTFVEVGDEDAPTATVTKKVLEDGYYVVGTMTNWEAEADYAMVLNEENTEFTEYMLVKEFEAGAELKVVSLMNGAVAAWYPSEGGNLVINVADEYTIFFRPNADGGEGWYYNVIYAYNPLAEAKLALQTAIAFASELNPDGLAEAIAAAQTALTAEDASLESLAQATETLEAAVKTFIGEVLPRLGAIVQALNEETLNTAYADAQAALANENVTPQELAAAMQEIITAAQTVAPAHLNTLKGYAVKYGQEGDADVVDAALAAIQSGNVAQIITTMAAVNEVATPLAQQVLGTMKTYVEQFGLTEQAAQAQAALESGNYITMITTAKALFTSLIAAANEYMPKLAVLVEGINDETLNAAYTNAQNVLANENVTPEDLGTAMQQIIAAAKTVAPAHLQNLRGYAEKYGSQDAVDKVDAALTAIEAGNVSQIIAAMTAVREAATPLATNILRQIIGYARSYPGFEDDVTAAQTVLDGGNYISMINTAKALYDKLIAAANDYVTSVKAIPTEGKAGADNLNAAIEAAELALAAQDADFSTIATAIDNLRAAVQAFKDANAEYYVVGTMNDWTVSDTYKMTFNEDAEGLEFVLTLDLEANTELKVRDNLEGWYPGGDSENLKIDEAGQYTIYFRPNADGGEGWYYNYIHVAKVDANAMTALLATAKGLVDEDAVAVGKLQAAIAEAEAIGNPNEDQIAALQAAIDQFNLDNADQESDQTAKVATNGWKKFTGNDIADLAPDWAAPAVTTYDGRTAQPAEVYETNVTTTGQILYQDITGLTNGKYKVGFYGTAFFTPNRGFESTMEDGADDVAYVFANDEKSFITARIGTSFSEYSLLQFDVEVTDGQIKLGMGKDKAGTNWHTMQIYQLTWFTTAKEAYAADQDDLAALVAQAKALLSDENKTEGKEAFEAVVATAEEATAAKKNWYNISEIEKIIADLRTAIANFKKANWFIDLAAGEYYIIDAESGMKMAAGNDYGTRGIVNEMGLDLTLTPYTESRTVTIDSRVSNGGNNHFLGSNLYMDSSEWGWALEYQGFGFYILEPVSGKYINVSTTNNNLELSDTPREWIIVTKEGVIAQHMEEMAEASENNPVDATFLLQNPNFNRNDQRVAAWTVSDDCTNKNLNGGNQVNNCAESYHSTFTIMQTVSGAPAGLYKMTAQGFYRQDAYEGDEPAAPVFFANGKNQDVPVKTGEEGGMSDASVSFTSGLYTIEPITFVVKEDGMMYVGVTASTNTQWVIFDNFQLTYYGPYTYQKGDANMDAEVTTGDAVLAVNVALEKETLSEAAFALADVNESNTITVADAVGIVNIALGLPEYNEPTARVFGTNDFLSLNGQQLSLTNTTSFVGFQMDVTLDNGATLNGVQLSQRARGLQVVTNKIGNNTWRIVAFSLNNTAITGSEGNLLTIDANSEMTISNIEFADAAANAYELGFADPTGISTINSNVEKSDVYNLGGQKVQKAQKGLYIVNGRKVVIK